MNVKNNRQKQRSKEKIEGVFLELLKINEISQITVSSICKKASLNRSTFYANYLDIYDLAESIKHRLIKDIQQLYENDMINNVGENYLDLFNHIKENQIFYKAYFKLGFEKQREIDLREIHKNKDLFPETHLKYHIIFHEAGLNAIINYWLSNGCKESPEEMNRIIQDEYSGR